MRTEQGGRLGGVIHGPANRGVAFAEAVGKLRLRGLRALLRGGEQGSALVEFAMVLPMLLVLTTGIMMFGIAMNNYLALTNAVSIGARMVAVDAGLTLDPCSVASTAIVNASPALKSSSLNFSYTFNGVAASGTSCASADVASGMAADLASGSTVTVTATYPLNLSVFGTRYTRSTAVLSATSTEMVQ